jgi:3-hydroxybenzoate 6-monooxygenase
VAREQKLPFIRRLFLTASHPAHWSRGNVTLLGDAAVGDALCFAEAVGRTDGAFTRAFQEYEAVCYHRTGRVRYHSDNVYHSREIEREVARQGWAAKTEQDVFESLAWLYNG